MRRVASPADGVNSFAGGTKRERGNAELRGHLSVFLFPARRAAQHDPAARREAKVNTMVTKTVYLTPEGKAALEHELDQLLTRRQELLKRIQEERDFGAFAEGGEPDADKTDLAFVEGRILTIENQLRQAVIVTSH